MLKPVLCANFKIYRFQPPSGGCVLKRGMTGSAVQFGLPAAFGRLCVETSNG